MTETIIGSTVVQSVFIQDTAANLLSMNPVIPAGQLAETLDTNVFAIGDGVTAWNSLPKFRPSTDPVLLSSETVVANTVISAVTDIITGCDFTVGPQPWVVDAQMPWIVGTVAGMIPLFALRKSDNTLVKQRVGPALSNPLQGGVAYGSGDISAIISTPGEYSIKLSMSRFTGTGTLGYGAASSPQLAVTLSAKPYAP